MLGRRHATGAIEKGYRLRLFGQAGAETKSCVGRVTGKWSSGDAVQEKRRQRIDVVVPEMEAEAAMVGGPVSKPTIYRDTSIVAQTSRMRHPSTDVSVFTGMG